MDAAPHMSQDLPHPLRAWRGDGQRREADRHLHRHHRHRHHEQGLQTLLQAEPLLLAREEGHICYLYLLFIK